MLASDLIKKLEEAVEIVGDVGVYVFEGDSLAVKVEVLEESDMIVIRNKTKTEIHADYLEAVTRRAESQ